MRKPIPTALPETPPHPLPPAASEGESGTLQADVGKPDSAKQRTLGFVFGIAFGFLLQKGGVGKYEVLMGSLLLTDFTVMKIILTAIATGMVGVFAMHSLGLVKLHVKPTRYAANIVGGLIFGVGFGLLGYCPGTGAAALGQGNWDAAAGILGMIAGSHLYAELSNGLASSILTWGNRGSIMLPDLIGMRLRSFLIAFVPILVAALWVLHLLTG